MAIFAIMSEKGTGAEKLDAAIKLNFPQDHLTINPGSWLVAWKGTPSDLSAKLGISDATTGSAVVVSISTYFGRASPDIWVWIKTKWEETSG